MKTLSNEQKKKEAALKKLAETRAVLIRLARTHAAMIYRRTERPVTAGEVYKAVFNFLDNNDSFQEQAELIKKADKRWLGAVFNPNNWTIDSWKPYGSHRRRVATWRPRGKL